MQVRRGQNTVEMAVILLWLVLFLLVAVDYGRVFFVGAVVSNSARVAVEYAASIAPGLPTVADIKSQAVAAGKPFVQAADVDVDFATRARSQDPVVSTPWTSAATPGPGQPIRVTVRAQYRPFFPITRAFISDPFTLQSRSWMRRPCQDNGGNADCPNGSTYYFPLPQ